MLKTVGFPSTRTGDQTIVNGNLVIGTAGKGIDFSADPSAAGMTSELLDDYEEGTWTPVVTPGAGAFTTVTITSATYTKIGRTVTVQAVFRLNDAGTGAGSIDVAGLPFAASSDWLNTPFACRRANDGVTLFGRVNSANVDDIRTVAYASGIVNNNTYALVATYAV